MVKRVYSRKAKLIPGQRLVEVTYKCVAGNHPFYELLALNVGERAKMRARCGHHTSAIPARLKCTATIDELLS